MINFKTIIRIIGILLLLETVMFLVCSGVSFYYRESDMLDFWKAGGITAGVGLLLAALGKGGERQLTRRDGYVLVSFAWVAFSLFGMLPFYIGGYIPDIANAFFETMSGFSSTGATILDDIESLPHGILFWRSMTQWIANKKNPCSLKVIPMTGWKHGSPYSLPIKPSPNLPNDQSIRLYASLCPFEATRVSVGRGTTFPFQVLGAPNKKYGSFTFTPRSLPGFDKNPMHKGITCYGEDLRNITDVNGFTLRYFLNFYRLSGENAAFFSRARWFDLLMGTDSVRKAILKGESEEAIRNSWQKELQDYKEIRKKYLLYE